MRSWLLLGVVGWLQSGCGLADAPTGTTNVTSSPSSNTEGVPSEVITSSTSSEDPGESFVIPTAGEYTGTPIPPAPPPIIQENDPCGVMNCEAGRGCCHNPLATEFNAYPREFLVDCLPEPRGQVDGIRDPECPDYSCETVFCLWKGCRLDSGQSGVRAEEFQVTASGPDVHGRLVEIDYGCVDERWLIRRNESGVPPDPTLECAAEYWWPEAGPPGSIIDATTSSSIPGRSSDAGGGFNSSGDAGAFSRLDASL